MQRTDSLENTLILGKIEGGRRRGRQRISWLDASLTQWTWVWVNSGSWWWAGKPGMLQSMGLQRVGTLLNELNWTDDTGEKAWTHTHLGLNPESFLASLLNISELYIHLGDNGSLYVKCLKHKKYLIKFFPGEPWAWGGQRRHGHPPALSVVEQPKPHW